MEEVSEIGISIIKRENDSDENKQNLAPNETLTITDNLVSSGLQLGETNNDSVEIKVESEVSDLSATNEKLADNADECDISEIVSTLLQSISETAESHSDTVSDSGPGEKNDSGPELEDVSSECNSESQFSALGTGHNDLESISSDSVAPEDQADRDQSLDDYYETIESDTEILDLDDPYSKASVNRSRVKCDLFEEIVSDSDDNEKSDSDVLESGPVTKRRKCNKVMHDSVKTGHHGDTNSMTHSVEVTSKNPNSLPLPAGPICDPVLDGGSSCGPLSHDTQDDASFLETDHLRVFNVLDEAGESEEDQQGEGALSETSSDQDSEFEVHPDEIDAMLEEGLNGEEPRGTKRKRVDLEVEHQGEGEEEVEPIPWFTCEKEVLIEKGKTPFDILPEGWVQITHNSGMPVYLHKLSRVCCLSRPYFLGTGSTRKHNIPVSAVPCLQYLKELEKEGVSNGSGCLRPECKEGTEEGLVEKIVTDMVDDAIEMDVTSANVDIKELKTKNEINVVPCTVEEISDNVEAMEESNNTSVSDRNINSYEADEEQKGTSESHEESNGESGNAEELIHTSVVVEEPKNTSLEADKSNSTVGIEEQDCASVAPESNSNSQEEVKAAPMTTSAMASNEEIRIESKQINGGIPTVCVEVKTAAQHQAEHSLTPEEMRAYCKKRFQFKVLHLRKFRSWVERRNHYKIKEKKERLKTHNFPADTKIITLPVLDDGVGNSDKKRKKWILNPKGKSNVCILHEYVQRTLKSQVTYTFSSTQNPTKPYEATIKIDEIKYGTGVGSSKREAKSAAAKASIEILIPNYKDILLDDDKPGPRNRVTNDVSFFDHIAIEDPRVTELCMKASEPLPYNILVTCLQRNFCPHVTDIKKQIKVEMKTLKHQKNEFVMTVGKHTASVMCKNKKEGKQLAAQSILQALHPHIDSWGSLLRLYGKDSFCDPRTQRQLEKEITSLQSHASDRGPNKAILEKLKQEMRWMKNIRDSCLPIGQFTLPDTISLPTKGGVNLDSVDIL